MTREIVLVNLGTPADATAAAVRDFLDEFLSDPQVVDWPKWIWQPVLRGVVLRRRPARVAAAYARIWTPEGSPLRVATEALGHALAARAPKTTRISVAYRYGAPGLEAAVEAALNRARTVCVVPLFAQATASSSGTILRLVRAAAAKRQATERVSCRLLAPDEPHYIAASRARCEAAFARFPDGMPERLVMSFHSLPARVDRKEGHVYSRACETTATALRAALGLHPDHVQLTYQSRFGPEPWLGPATEASLVALADAGVRHVAVAAPGFLTPGLETLEELGMRARAAFLDAGGRQFELVDAPAGRTELTDALLHLGSEEKARQ